MLIMYWVVIEGCFVVFELWKIKFNEFYYLIYDLIF